MTDNSNGVTGRIRVDLNDSVIWNQHELLEFLIQNQNGVIDIEIPEGVALDNIGIYRLLDLFSFKSVTLRTFNIVQDPHPVYKLEFHTMAFRYFNVPSNINYSQYHKWTQRYVFGALYNRPTWTRLGLASYLYSHHRSKTMLNFRYDPLSEEDRKIFEINQLFQVDPMSIESVAKLMPNLPLRLEDVDSYTVGGTTVAHTNQLSKFYQEFLIDIVAETFVQGRCFYPTEKTTRSILMKKPFIIMGPKCFLIHLRQMGFKTFHEFWNEDYDGYNTEQRYSQVLKLINELSNKPIAELQDMYQRMQPVLEHNYQLLVEKKFTQDITYVN